MTVVFKNIFDFGLIFGLSILVVATSRFFLIAIWPRDGVLELFEVSRWFEHMVARKSQILENFQIALER